MPQAPARRKKVTLQDVARAASVSNATASLALQNNPRISEPTRQRVWAAVKALGYVYNRHAASLRTQRSSTVGFIIADLANPFYAEMIAGAEAVLVAQDFSLLLGTTGNDIDRQARSVRTMLERDVDGLFLATAAGTEPAALQEIMRFCPLVMVTDDYADMSIDFVAMDNEEGSRRATAYLIQLGHRRIAFVGGSEEMATRQSRLRGYRQALASRGLPCDAALCVESPITRRGGYLAIQRLLAADAPPTAAYCFSDVNAFGVMLGLRAASLEAGKDFAVVGFDNVAEASLWQPSLTTVATNPSAMGEQLARILLQRIAEPDMPVQRIFMPSRLIERDSTGPPARSLKDSTIPG